MNIYNNLKQDEDLKRNKQLESGNLWPLKGFNNFVGSCHETNNNGTHIMDSSRRRISMGRLAGLLIFVFFIGYQGLQAQVRVNEVQSQNSNTILDEDGAAPDWIELFNAGDTAVNLGGWGITDKSALPFQWIFPNLRLDTGQYLLLFASDKDRRTAPVWWETVVSINDSFQYIIPSANIAGWREPAFNDSSWSSGRSGFGYGDNDDSTIVPTGTLSVYFRKSFEISDAASVQQMLFHMDYDDAFVAYLNGHEIARANIGQISVAPDWNSPISGTDHEARMYQGGSPDLFAIDSLVPYLVTGRNVLAVEIHNVGSSSSDLSGIPFLTLGLSSKPLNARGTPSWINFKVPNLHTNFKLSSAGDTVLLFYPDGSLADSITFGAIPKDLSLGMQPDGTGNRVYFVKPTPGSPNTTQGYSAAAFALPVFSVPAGFFSDSITLTITGAGEQDTIFYTTDGSEPGPGSLRYTGTLHLDSTVVIRACISGPGIIPNNIVTKSYIIRNPVPALTTLSISTTPSNFFDWNTGIYELGPNASPDNPNFGANFWQDWERPVHFELFEKDGKLGYQADAGVKIAGAYSRANPQKSLAFYARSNYGTPSFKYSFFTDPPFTEYQNIYLRNSGNDFNNTQFRDGFLQSLMDGTAVDRMAYRPTSVYINGAYWGVMEIREKINEHYLAAHHGVDPLQLDMLETNSVVDIGDGENYAALLNYLNAHSPSVTQVYDSLTHWIDMENYTDYQVGQIYFNNTDWPGNNIKYWRPKTPNGRWRWIMYDTDFGFGIWNLQDYANNTLGFALDPNGPGWPNPPWSTFLFRKMVESPAFKVKFINRFADLLNSNFLYQNILEHINTMSGAIQAEMPYHMARWGSYYAQWVNNVSNMKTFGNRRNKTIRAYIRSQFTLAGYDTLTIETSSANSGTIHLNTLEISSFPWKGVYFWKVSIPVTARPAPGYRFVRWEGPVKDPNAASTEVYLTQKDVLRAVFDQDGSNISDVVINEINYNSSPDFNPEDWVELYNRGLFTIDVSGWVLKDMDNTHRYAIPQGTYLYPDGYLVLARDAAKYIAAFPSKSSPYGSFTFGLGSTLDEVRLFTADSILVDSVMYTSSYPWPAEANGTGASLELINPGYDNSLPASWKASSLQHGTPGEKNSVYIDLPSAVSSPEGLSLMLEQNYPNPFSITTCIHFEVPVRDKVRLLVYDLQGRLLSVLVNGEMEAGRHEYYWDGSDASGSTLPSGMYLLKLETSGMKVARSMAIMR